VVIYLADGNPAIWNAATGSRRLNMDFCCGLRVLSELVSDDAPVKLHDKNMDGIIAENAKTCKFLQIPL
jgi:hypothetical protein